MKWGLAIVALVLALVALGFGGAYYAVQPVQLRIAVPVADSQSRQFVETTAEILKTTKAAVQITGIATDDALTALAKNQADFAVARSVDIMRASAQTVLVLRRDAAVIVVQKTSKINDLLELTKASIGVVREGYMDGLGLAAVMNYYGVELGRLKLTPLAPGDVAAAIRDKRVNALVIAGNLRSQNVADAVSIAAKGFKGGIRILDIEAAEAIAKRLPEVEAIEIDQGLFGGTPPLPDDAVDTVGMSVRLVADSRLGKDKVSDFLHVFSTIKQQLMVRVPGSGGISIPDPDDETAFVLHQGVHAFNKGEIINLSDKYGDQIYFGGLLASGLGSLCAGVFGMIESRRRRRSIAQVMEIEELRRRVEDVSTDGELAEIEARCEDIFRLALRKAMNDELEPAAVTAFQLSHGQLRDRIGDRRRALMDNRTPVAALVSSR
jgi:TRAP-type uncharacterized transport system substrate-binding protein